MATWIFQFWMNNPRADKKQLQKLLTFQTVKKPTNLFDNKLNRAGKFLLSVRALKTNRPKAMVARRVSPTIKSQTLPLYETRLATIKPYIMADPQHGTRLKQ